MLSNKTTPRFRNLSINATSRFFTSSTSFGDKDQGEHRDPEKECFMCRQANVYLTPIGMQQERQVERRHPPPLSRAQMEELSQKKRLTKREARKLLQCYFPEIKNVKYFQLHKYHSCCYDPKHLNLCKNHITALQHQPDQCPKHKSHKHEKDEDLLKTHERDDGQQNRVSFVRIKIEPTRGIPTRFLGPTALPASLADMLIKQVNRLENKKKPPEFGSLSEGALPMYNVRRIEQPYALGTGRLSEHLANLDSDNDDDDEDEDDYSSEDGSDQDDKQPSNPTSSIRGYHGKVMDRSRLKYERKIQSKQERERSKTPTTVTNGDLVVEDLDDVKHLFVNGKEPSISTNKSSKSLKKKRRRRRTRKPKHTHETPKLNHWEALALDQSKQEVCGCRHHVRRLEANQIVYDWCRCKDHQHKNLKEKPKPIPPPPPPPTPPPSPPAKKPKKIIRRPKPPVIETKSVGIDATEPTTTELALAYDPETVDYDVIQETLYYRTSSGRLVKPEITNAFTYDNTSSSAPSGRHKTLPKADVIYTTLKDHFQTFDGGVKRPRKNRHSPTLSITESVPNDRTLINPEVISPDNDITSEYKPPNSVTRTKYPGDDDGDDNQSESSDFAPPKFIPEKYTPTPVQSPTIPMSMQRSSKPTYVNQAPTPNFQRESSILANRRWFDQALGDQNLREVHDGRYGLIAGTSTEQYQISTQLPDNDYVEQNAHRNRNNCTIS